MNFYDFFQFTQKFQRSSQAPSMASWPDEIKFGSQTWDAIKKLYKFTKKDGFEYEISLFYADGDVVSSNIERGSRQHVLVKHQLGLRYEPHQKTQTYEKQILIDGRIVKKSLKKPHQLPKRNELGAIFNVHSHPPQNYHNEKVYSFFSPTDLNSLLTGNSPSIGLVTNEFWLIGKTSQAGRALQDIEIEKLKMANELYIKGDNVNDFINKHFHIGIVFYQGSFGSPIKRVN